MKHAVPPLSPAAEALAQVKARVAGHRPWRFYDEAENDLAILKANGFYLVRESQAVLSGEVVDLVLVDTEADLWGRA